jgi:hypothetical protein
MAKKISKSIVSGLDRLRKALGGAPEKPAASKKSASSKKPAAPKKSAKRAEPRPTPPPAPAAADQAASQGNAAKTPEAKEDKKKAIAQPWFRHRQRW